MTLYVKLHYQCQWRNVSLAFIAHALSLAHTLEIEKLCDSFVSICVCYSIPLERLNSNIRPSHVVYRKRFNSVLSEIYE